MTPDNIVTTMTDDRWRLDLRHYAADGPPVILVHGMGANHYNWDFREEVSLAAYLQTNGWDVWVPELRGEEGTQPPNRKARRSFSFDDYAVYDIPAIVDEVMKQSDTDAVYWVGHSMGGLLLYTYLARKPERVVAAVTISSPADFTVGLKLHKSVKNTAWMWNGNGVIPARDLARMLPPVGRAHAFVPRLANPKNMDGATINGLSWYALENVRRPVAKQAVTWLKARELVKEDGTPWLRPTQTPLLAMAGVRDKIVAPEDVKTTCDLFERCEFVSLGVEGGFSTDYGHVDSVLGETARAEVYPMILRWLDGQREAFEATALVEEAEAVDEADPVASP